VIRRKLGGNTVGVLRLLCVDQSIPFRREVLLDASIKSAQLIYNIMSCSADAKCLTPDKKLMIDMVGFDLQEQMNEMKNCLFDVWSKRADMTWS